MSAALQLRTLTPEWLDVLPPDDPRARRSRRDLRVVNALMGNARAMASALRAVPLARVAELGAGSGHMLARVARALRRETPVDAVLVDRQPCIEAEAMRQLQGAGWRAEPAAADVFAWLEAQPDAAYDAIVANLFLHHFDDAALANLLALAARKCRVFVACEPLRSRFAESAARLLPILGCNDVTRHDAVVSVQAGFRDREITSLWPPTGWHCVETRCGLFTHRFVATRS